MKNEIKKGLIFGFGAILIISIISVAVVAHTDENKQESNHMNLNMASMHERMHGNSDINQEGCHEMMDHMDEMSIEDMDKDNDGVCDMCGMAVESCQMMLEHNR